MWNSSARAAGSRPRSKQRTAGGNRIHDSSAPPRSAPAGGSAAGSLLRAGRAEGNGRQVGIGFMIHPRRRDLLLLAALPLGAFPARAAQSPAAAPSTLPPALKNEKEAAEATVEIPDGAIPALNSGPLEGMRWQMRYYFDELGKRCHLQDFALPTPQFGLASLLIEEPRSEE